HMPMPDPVVHKFGGSSLADAECYRRAAAILRARPAPRRAVVVSAAAGVTNALLAAVEQAARADRGFVEALDGLRATQHALAAELVPEPARVRLTAAIDADIADIRDVLHAATLLHGASRETFDLVSGYGEVWSARLLAAHLESVGEAAEWLDARAVLVARPARPAAAVEGDASRELLAAWLERSPRTRAWADARPEPTAANPRAPPDAATIVITGFIAMTPDGRATTLGRNGSDFSASIFAALLDAAEVHIWTDVDGVMSADPRLVPD